MRTRENPPAIIRLTYDLAVREGEPPLDDIQGGSTYDELYERYLESGRCRTPRQPPVIDVASSGP